MALEKKVIDAKLNHSALSKEELQSIDDMEAYIDSVIKSKYKGNEISIPAEYANFSFRNEPKAFGEPRPNDYPFARRKIMTKELENRFKKAGWKVRIDVGEDDGPNRPALDYWVLH